MRITKTAVYALAGAFIVLTVSCSAAPDGETESSPAPATLHSWQAIVYPDLPCPWATKTVRPTLHPNTTGNARGLELHLTFHMPPDFGDEGRRFVSPDVKQIDVRLHYPDGTVVQRSRNNDPVLDAFDDVIPFAGGSLGGTGTLRRTFPWGRNELREAWIELRISEMVYWLAVPYGFTRDPGEPLCASEKVGSPKFAPAMSALEKDAKIVNWRYVEYELDPPHGGWRLKLRQSNPFDSACVVVLYMGSTAWDLHTPRTAVRVEQPELAPLAGQCWNIDAIDGNRDGNRHDSFRFNRGSTETRCWGSVVVIVGDKETSTVVPSSLFNYVHGVADPYHKANFR